MKSSTAAVLAATKIVDSVPHCTGLTTAAAAFVGTHFESLQEELEREDSSQIMDQLLARIKRRAARIIVPGNDGLATEADVMALHAHLEEVGAKLRRGGCAYC